jgi:hypothetical protein
VVRRDLQSERLLCPSAKHLDDGRDLQKHLDEYGPKTQERKTPWEAFLIELSYNVDKVVLLAVILVEPPVADLIANALL